MTATPFTMDVVTVTCYDTKNRDQRPNEDLFYQFYLNYLPAFLFESLFLSINQNLLPRGERAKEDVWLVGLLL